MYHITYSANRDPALSLFASRWPIQMIRAAPMRFHIISYRKVGWNNVPVGQVAPS